MNRLGVLVLLACAVLVSGQAKLEVVDGQCKGPEGPAMFQTGVPVSQICSDVLSVHIMNVGDQPQTDPVDFALYWASECLPEISPSSSFPVQRFNSQQAVSGMQPGEKRELDISSFVLDGSLPDCSPGCVMVVMETSGAGAPSPVLGKMEMEQGGACADLDIDAKLSVDKKGDPAAVPDWTLQQNGDVYEAPLSDILNSVSLTVKVGQLHQRSWPWSIIAFVRHDTWGVYLPTGKTISGAKCHVPHVSLEDTDIGTLTRMSLNTGDTWTEDSNLANLKLRMKVGDCPICGHAKLVIAFDPFSEINSDEEPCDNFVEMDVNIVCPESIQNWNRTAMEAITEVLTSGNTMYVKRCRGQQRPDLFRYQFFEKSWQKVDRKEVFTWAGIKRQLVFANRLAAEKKAADPDFCSKVFQALAEREGGEEVTGPLVFPTKDCVDNLIEARSRQRIPTVAEMEQTKQICAGNPLVVAVTNAYLRHIEFGGEPPKHMLFRFGNDSAPECPSDPALFWGAPSVLPLIKPLERLIMRSEYLWKMADGNDCEDYPEQACATMTATLELEKPFRLAIGKDMKQLWNPRNRYYNTTIPDEIKPFLPPMNRQIAKAVINGIMQSIGQAPQGLDYIDDCPLPDPYSILPLPGVFFRVKGDKVQMSMRNFYEQEAKQYCYMDVAVLECSHCTRP